MLNARYVTTRPLTVRLLATLALVVVLGSTATPTRAATDYPWLDDMVLVVVDADDPASFRRAQGIVQAYGFQVALLAPPNIVVGWMEPRVEAELRRVPEVLNLYDGLVPRSKSATLAKSAQRMVRFFNRTVTGELQTKMALQKVQGATATPRNREDAFNAPYDPLATARSLVARGHDLGELEKRGIFSATGAKRDNTAVMSGTVVVSLFMAESDGTGTDPNQYDWPQEDAQNYFEQINVGLAWWSSTSYTYGCWVAFMVDAFFPDDPNMNQPLEQILHPASTVPTLVTNVLGNLGFVGDHFAATDAWNVSQRALWNADRSYSAFVAYTPSLSELPGGGPGAFAYLYGPYTFLLSDAHPGPESEVLAHETGHIFGPCDEYLSSGCTCNALDCRPNGVANNNCSDCTFNPCMMKADDFIICTYTDAHVGWRLTECSPPALPNPILVSLSPSAVVAGETADITVTGQNFFLGTTIDLGPDVVINSTTYVSDTQVVANITVLSPAAPGLIDVTVLNRDLRTGTLVNAFDVIPTPVHYVDSAGGDNYPYLTPADAAPTIADVLTATGPGDEVRILSTDSFLGANLQVNRSTYFSGGWDAGFVSQDLVNGKTLIDLNVNLWFKQAGGLDGFVVQDGSGRAEFDPDEVRRGGAVFAQDADLSITNCEFINNVAGGQLLNGTGGAIYVRNGNVLIEDTVFTGNLSRSGGAIYLENCTGSIARNTFTNNVSESLTSGSIGGGIYLEGCSTITFAENDFVSNDTEVNGAGLYALDCTGLVMTGGSFTGHTVTADGAGIYLLNSELVAQNVVFQSNDAGAFGGGIGAAGASSLTVRDCMFLQNEAQLGGGLSVLSSNAFVEHSLFSGNTCDFSGSAAYVASPAAGSFVGNTIDGNLSTLPGGPAVFFASAAIPVFNNIVSSSSDVGVFCSGVLQPALSYNLASNNGGDDTIGCTDLTAVVTGDPLFVDAVGGDFHLGLHSAAIDTGNPGVGFEDPDGSRGDLGWYGAHAFTMDQPGVPKGLEATANGDNVQLTWTANPETDVQYYAVYGSTGADFVPNAASFLTLVTAPATGAGLVTSSRYFRISAVDTDGYASGYSTEALAGIASSVGDGIPNRFALDQNVPNPFNPSTTIHYSVDRESLIDLSIYDSTGRKVAGLVSRRHAPGKYSVRWNGTTDEGVRVSSGVYYSKLVAGSREVSRKMILLK